MEDMMSGGSLLRSALLRSPALYRAAAVGSILARYYSRRLHDPDFAVFGRYPADGMFLDIGANAGTSALSFRCVNRRSPVLSIEANPFHEADLRRVRRMVRAFDYRILAASNGAGTMTLYVPCHRGVAVTGCSSLIEEEAVESFRWWSEQHFGSCTEGPDGRELDLRQVRVQTLPVDDLHLAPSAIKIDVEGYEPEVLEGMTATLRMHRPLLLIEKCTRWREMKAHLEASGYGAHTVVDGRLAAFDQRATNVVFATPEHVAIINGPPGGRASPSELRSPASAALRPPV